MKGLAFLLAAALAARAQFPSLAPTDDGKQLYFSTTLRLPGETPGSDSRIFRYSDAGLELFAAQPPDLPGYHDAYIQPAFYMPFVSDDGRTVAYTGDAYCPPFYACLAGPYATGVVRGRNAGSPGEGTLSVSHNGRWATLTARNYSGGHSGPNSYFMDLVTGDRTLVPYQLFPPVSIADDGSTAVSSSYIQAVWRPDRTLPVPLTMRPGGPVALSADGRTVVGMEPAFGGAPGDIYVYRPESGLRANIAEFPDPNEPFQYLGISNDGTWVLYRRSGPQWQAVLVNTATLRAAVIPLPNGAAATSGALSGYANTAFFGTSDGHLVAVDLADGVPAAVRTLW